MPVSTACPDCQKRADREGRRDGGCYSGCPNALRRRPGAAVTIQVHADGPHQATRTTSGTLDDDRRRRQLARDMALDQNLTELMNPRDF